jgi:hypothetical protein
MLAADQGRADVFDLEANPESGDIAPSDIGRLHNGNGYIHSRWTKTQAQLISVSGIFGTLIGNGHPEVLTFGHFLRMYKILQIRLKTKLDNAHRRQLGQCMVNFHVQLALRNWMVVQLDVNERESINVPVFVKG